MMKRLPVYLLALFLLVNTGCLKTQSTTPSTSQYPSGTYTGVFQRIHKNALKGSTDTLSANLQLTLNVTTGFAITGDTSTVHAGSYGAYAFNPTYAYFADVTFPKSGTLTKVHLDGTYLYYYDGSTLQFLQSNDTLTYFYNFKAVAN